MGNIVWFNKFGNGAVENLVGNKAMSINRLSEEGFNTPKGFVIANEAYEEFKSSAKNKNLFDETEVIELPQNIAADIETAYNSLNVYRTNERLRAFDFLKSGENVEAAIRTEDYSKLSVKGVKQINNAIKEIYTECVLRNRDKCYVIIQKMVKSDVSGEIYSFNENIIIDACFGLGQNRKYSGADRYELSRNSQETKIAHFSQHFAYYGGSGRVEEVELGVKKAEERKLKSEQLQKLKETYIDAEEKIGKNLRLKFAVENGEIFFISLFADNYYSENAGNKFFDKIDSSETAESKFVSEDFAQDKLEKSEENMLNEMSEEFREKLSLDIIEPEKMSSADLYDSYREEIISEDEETEAGQKKILELMEEEEKKLREIDDDSTENFVIDEIHAEKRDSYVTAEKNDEEIDLYNYKEEVKQELSGEKLSAQSLGLSKVPKFEINEYIKNLSGENPKVGDLREINELLHDIDEKIDRNAEEDVSEGLSGDEERTYEETEESDYHDYKTEEKRESKINRYEDNVKDSLEEHREGNEDKNYNENAEDENTSRRIIEDKLYEETGDEEIEDEKEEGGREEDESEDESDDETEEDEKEDGEKRDEGESEDESDDEIREDEKEDGEREEDESDDEIREDEKEDGEKRDDGELDDETGEDEKEEGEKEEDESNDETGEDEKEDGEREEDESEDKSDDETEEDEKEDGEKRDEGESEDESDDEIREDEKEDGEREEDESEDESDDEIREDEKEEGEKRDDGELDDETGEDEKEEGEKRDEGESEDESDDEIKEDEKEEGEKEEDKREGDKRKYEDDYDDFY